MSELSVPALGKWVFALFVAQWFDIEQASRGMITTLVILMVLDYITGLLAGFATQTLSSMRGARGMAIKGLILILILTSHIIEKAMGHEFHLEFAGALGYAINECISIVENCALAGVPIFAPLLNALIVLKSIRPRSATPAELAELAGQTLVERGLKATAEVKPAE